MGEAAAGRLADDYALDDDGHFKEGTFLAQFRDNFKSGRKTAKECDYTHRMPNPEHGCMGRGEGKDGLKQIFVDHIFKAAKHPWTYTTAINGAHTVGKASLENSGYEGFWGSKTQSAQFNNDYYKAMLMGGWGPLRHVDGNADKNMWVRSDYLGVPDAKTVHDYGEMMLTTDMCLAYAHTKNNKECRETSPGADQNIWCANTFNFNGATSPQRELIQGWEDLDPSKHYCCTWLAGLTSTGMNTLVPNENFWEAEGRALPDKVDFCGHNFYKEKEKISDLDKELGYYDKNSPVRKDGFPQ